MPKYTSHNFTLNSYIEQQELQLVLHSSVLVLTVVYILIIIALASLQVQYLQPIETFTQVQYLQLIETFTQVQYLPPIETFTQVQDL